LKETFSTYPVDHSYLDPKTVVGIDRVYNRLGWDFAGRSFGFAARVNDIVIAGVYDKHVLDALEHAWHELQLEVNDRIPWDLIGVIEGPDKIGARTAVTLRDKASGAEIGTIEEWATIECTRIRIIGLHAGPVAVARQ
jgi:hypothetical protein